jgi:predicted RNA-binding protein with TRAM domain
MIHGMVTKIDGSLVIISAEPVGFVFVTKILCSDLKEGDEVEVSINKIKKNNN